MSTNGMSTNCRALFGLNGGCGKPDAIYNALMRSPAKFTLAALVIVLGILPPAFAQKETALSGYNFEGLPPILWQLPKQLGHASGLALTPGGGLFTHQEKRAIIWQIDWRKGTLGKSFHLGKGIKSGFEGIAILGPRFYLASRKGGVFHFREGFEGEGKPFSVYDTGTGNFCEVGGLTGRPGTAELLLVCSKPKKDTPKGQITIFVWDSVTKDQLITPYLEIPLPEELEGARPTGIAALPDGSGFLVLTTGERFLIEIAWDGEIVGWRALQKGFHNNPSGLAITQDGDIIILDEGKRGQVSVYQADLMED